MLDDFTPDPPLLQSLPPFTTALYSANHEEPPRAAREQRSSSCSYATADEELSSTKAALHRMHESGTEMEMTPSHVSIDEHKRVLRDNAKLSKELERTNEESKKAGSDAEVARTAFQKLADWAYNERKQLLAATDGPNCVGDARQAIAKRNDRLLREQIQRSDAAWARFTKDLLARREQAEGALLAMNDGHASTELQSSNGQTLGHAWFQPVDASLVARQVDQLITEEKGRLPRF